MVTTDCTGTEPGMLYRLSGLSCRSRGAGVPNAAPQPDCEPTLRILALCMLGHDDFELQMNARQELDTTLRANGSPSIRSLSFLLRLRHPESIVRWNYQSTLYEKLAQPVENC